MRAKGPARNSLPGVRCVCRKMFKRCVEHHSMLFVRLVGYAATAVDSGAKLFG